MMIENYDELKFTSLKHGVGIIHFKYKGIDYTLKNGGREMTLVMQLYKGRMKCHLEYIKGSYGADFGIIKYKNNRKNLRAIDKEYFVLSLVKHGLIDGTKEQLIKIKQIKKDDLLKELNLLREKINKVNDDILDIDKGE